MASVQKPENSSISTSGSDREKGTKKEPTLKLKSTSLRKLNAEKSDLEKKGKTKLVGNYPSAWTFEGRREDRSPRKGMKPSFLERDNLPKTRELEKIPIVDPDGLDSESVGGPTGDHPVGKDEEILHEKPKRKYSRRPGESKLKTAQRKYDESRKESLKCVVARLLNIPFIICDLSNTRNGGLRTGLEDLKLWATSFTTVDEIRKKFLGTSRANALQFIANVLRAGDPANDGSVNRKDLKRLYQRNLGKFFSTVAGDISDVLHLGFSVNENEGMRQGSINKFDRLSAIGNRLVRMSADISLQSRSPAFSLLTPSILLSMGLTYAAESKLGRTFSEDEFLEVMGSIYKYWQSSVMDPIVELRFPDEMAVNHSSDGLPTIYSAIMVNLAMEYTIRIAQSTEFSTRFNRIEGSQNSLIMAHREAEFAMRDFSRSSSLPIDEGLWKTWIAVMLSMISNVRNDNQLQALNDLEVPLLTRRFAQGNLARQDIWETLLISREAPTKAVLERLETSAAELRTFSLALSKWIAEAKPEGSEKDFTRRRTFIMKSSCHLFTTVRMYLEDSMRCVRQCMTLGRELLALSSIDVSGIDPLLLPTPVTNDDQTNE